MKYSILVPVYNVDKYLPACLDSICAQQENDMEIILVDDGSTDNSLNICKAYTQKDERIQLIVQENAGVSAARNKALSAAKGTWVLFVDADDIIDIDTLQRINSLDVSCCDFVIFSKNANTICQSELQIYPIKERERFSLITIGMLQKQSKLSAVPFTSVCGKIFKREFLLKNNIIFDTDLVMGEDLFFNLHVLGSAGNVGLSTYDFYLYRNNFHSASMKKNAVVLQRDKLFQEKLLQFAETYHYEIMKTQGIIYSALNGILVCFHSYFSRFPLLDYRKYRNELVDFLSQEPYRSSLLNLDEYKTSFKKMQFLLLWFIKKKCYLSAALLKKSIFLYKHLKRQRWRSMT